MVDKNGSHPPGYYEPDVDKYPNLEKYPGHIQFPYPLELTHFKAWWKTAIESAKELTKLDWETFEGEWEGAKTLLLEYGEWEIKDVPRGHVKENRVSLELVSWVTECADDYIWPQLSVKKARLLSIYS